MFNKLLCNRFILVIKFYKVYFCVFLGTVAVYVDDVTVHKYVRAQFFFYSFDSHNPVGQRFNTTGERFGAGSTALHVLRGGR